MFKKFALSLGYFGICSILMAAENDKPLDKLETWLDVLSESPPIVEADLDQKNNLLIKFWGGTMGNFVLFGKAGVHEVVEEWSFRLEGDEFPILKVKMKDISGSLLVRIQTAIVIIKQRLERLRNLSEVLRNIEANEALLLNLPSHVKSVQTDEGSRLISIVFNYESEDFTFYAKHNSSSGAFLGYEIQIGRQGKIAVSKRDHPRMCQSISNYIKQRVGEHLLIQKTGRENPMNARAIYALYGGAAVAKAGSTDDISYYQGRLKYQLVLDSLVVVDFSFSQAKDGIEPVVSDMTKIQFIERKGEQLILAFDQGELYFHLTTGSMGFRARTSHHIPGELVGISTTRVLEDLKLLNIKNVRLQNSQSILDFSEYLELLSRFACHNLFK